MTEIMNRLAVALTDRYRIDRFPVQLNGFHVAAKTTKTSYSHARENLATLWDEVENSREAAVIQRRGHEDMALVPADELSSLRETAYLLRSPQNAVRLLAANRKTALRVLVLMGALTMPAPSPCARPDRDARARRHAWPGPMAVIRSVVWPSSPSHCHRTAVRP